MHGRARDQHGTHVLGAFQLKVRKRTLANAADAPATTLEAPPDLTAGTVPRTYKFSLLELLDAATDTTTETPTAAVHTLHSMQLFFQSVTMYGMSARAPATTADAPARRDRRRTRAVRPQAAQHPLVLSGADNARHFRRHVLPHVRNHGHRDLADQLHAAQNLGDLNLGAARQPNLHDRRRPHATRTPTSQHTGVI